MSRGNFILSSILYHQKTGILPTGGMTMKCLEYTAVSFTGAAGYGLLELLWRGWTHWTMLVVGGLCLLVMYGLANDTKFPYWQVWVLSAVFITTAEFVSGSIVNIALGWRCGITPPCPAISWDRSARSIVCYGLDCPSREYGFAGSFGGFCVRAVPRWRQFSQYGWFPDGPHPIQSCPGHPPKRKCPRPP